MTSIRFRPRFNGVAAPMNRFLGHGVVVNTGTGAVNPTTPAPAVPLRSFRIDAVVTVPNSANPGATIDLEPVPIRVYVHESITQISLTPAPLTIRHGADGQRFSVYAQFDDDTVGDITHIGEVDGAAPITWQSTDSTKIAVDASGAITVKVAPSNERIRAILSAPLGGDVADARVLGVAGWSAQPAAQRAARLVSGSGAARLDEVPNILFLSDGFTAGEQGEFQDLVTALVNLLCRKPITRPYDLLAGSINYWSVFIASPERGASVLYEVQPVGPVAGVTMALELPIPTAATGAAAFELRELIYEVGLPVLADRNVDRATKTAQWETLYGVARVPRARVTQFVYDDWQALHDRRLVNEVDTALGLAVGSRPSAVPGNPPRGMGWHPHRTTRAHLDDFLRTLTAGPGGAAIGRTWSRDPGTGRRGKDFTLVFILSGGSTSAGAQTPGEMVAVGVIDLDTVDVRPVPASRAVALEPNPLPRDPRSNRIIVVPETHAVVAHESAHAFGLLDEYGEQHALPPLAQLARPTRDDLARTGNVQPEDEVLVAGAPGGLEGALLRWRWPRISKAGVLAAAPSAQGGNTFRIRLKAGHAAPFKNGDTVHLRQRPLLKPLPAGGLATVNHALISRPLRITADPAGDELTLHDPSGTLNPADFPAVSPNESILLSPVPAPASAPGDPFAEVVAPIVRNWITTSRGPLNAPRANPTRACRDNDRVVQWAVNLPPGRRRDRPRYPEWIVGAYDGGAGYHCRIYRPAGACLMRTLRVPYWNERGVPTPNPGILYRFCAVCRYVIVDRLDPTKHGVLDAGVRGKGGYAHEYPQP